MSSNAGLQLIEWVVNDFAKRPLLLLLHTRNLSSLLHFTYWFLIDNYVHGIKTDRCNMGAHSHNPTKKVDVGKMTFSKN